MLAGWALIACAGIAALCFIAYLLFLVFVIVKTGETKGLTDVATAIRAYRVPLPGRRPDRDARDADRDEDMSP